MFKALLSSALLLTAFSSNDFNLDRFSHESIQEADTMQLFELYLQHLAPSHITKTPERYSQFKTEVLEIIAHNNNPENSWKRAINEFTGMTLNELEGSAVQAPQYCSATNGRSAIGLTDIPASFDWREKGIVTPVKNQGGCGSCWTFSTTGAVESHWALYKKSDPPLLSEQQLVDCAGDFDNHGCQGGLPSHAFEYIKYAGGLESEDDYPYKAKNGECKFDRTKVLAQIPHGSHNITEGDENALLEATYNVGPVSIAYQVTKDFMSYKSGVYVGKTCKNTTETVNHAVLVVGFGHDEESKLDYWLVKNSWSKTWGDQGYFKIQRGVNMCGIAVCASYPQIRDELQLETI